MWMVEELGQTKYNHNGLNLNKKRVTTHLLCGKQTKVSKHREIKRGSTHLSQIARDEVE